MWNTIRICAGTSVVKKIDADRDEIVNSAAVFIKSYSENIDKFVYRME